MTRHIVFGTGQVGHPVISQLVEQGHDVVAVNRKGGGHFPGAEVVGGDAADPAFTTTVCAGADVVYFCLNAMNYERWDVEFRPCNEASLPGRPAPAPGSSYSTTSTPTARRADRISSRPWGRTPPRRSRRLVQR